MNNFTQEDTRSLEELLKDYEGLSEKIKKINFKNLTDEDRKVLDNYADTSEFLGKIRNALDFTKSSTMVCYDKDLTLTCYSLMEKEEYVKNAVVLTGGFNEDFMRAVKETRSVPFETSVIASENYNESVNSPLKVKEISDEIKKYGDIDNIIKTKTISDALFCIDSSEKYMEKYNIEESNIANSTLEAFIYAKDEGNIKTLAEEKVLNRFWVSDYELSDETRMKEEIRIQEEQYAQENQEKILIEAELVRQLYEEGYRKDSENDLREDYALSGLALAGTLILLKEMEEKTFEESIKTAQKELEKLSENVEIVESNDGYVMNTSKITSENMKDYQTKTNGNEVVHNEAPRETTVDRASVGGNVKLEEAKDYGSREEDKIEAGVSMGEAIDENYFESKGEIEPQEKEVTKKERFDFER